MVGSASGIPTKRANENLTLTPNSICLGETSAYETMRLPNSAPSFPQYSERGQETPQKRPLMC